MLLKPVLGKLAKGSIVYRKQDTLFMESQKTAQKFILLIIILSLNFPCLP